jgi:flagellar hook protein FlgE
MPLTSYYTALTGLNNNSMAINVIGDNLANMNTTAFKSGQATFSELLAGVSGTDSAGNPISIGQGCTLNGITHNSTQGTITYTGISTDAAIQGNGFFIVSTNGDMGFTRSGAFNLNEEGDLISADGFQVMGYMGVDGVINANGAIAPITIQKGQLISPSVTQNMSVYANLDAEAEDGSVYSNTVQIFDSLGAEHAVSLSFTKTGAGAWSWTAAIPAEDTGGAAGDPPVEIGSGDLTFTDGLLTAPTTNPTLSIAGLANGAADFDVTFNLLDSDGNSNITNYARQSGVSTTVQDGYAASAVIEISIDNSGVIVGLTESGRTVSLAQLALANFPNVEGLQKYQGSTFVPFSSSGEPSIGVAGTGGRGTIAGSSLEQSNVDMAQEFVNLIKAQRAYQANSRIILTTDELYQESINLKR